MNIGFEQWWRIVRVVDLKGTDKCKYPFLLEDKCYAYGLHMEHVSTKRVVFCWEKVCDWGKYTTWDPFSTSTLVSVKETINGLSVTTKNSVFYFEKIDSPVLPDGSELLNEKPEETMPVEPTMYGKLLLLRAKQSKLARFDTVEDIEALTQEHRRRIIYGDFPIVDYINDNYDSEACIKDISNWLASRAAAFRKQKDREDEEDLYRSFFNYTLQMLCKGNVFSAGIDDLVKMAEVLQEDPDIYVGTFENCMKETKYKDMILDVQDWIDTELDVPRDFEKFALAAVAAFLGALLDPISTKNKE